MRNAASLIPVTVVYISRMSQERFYIESPNFTRTSTPVNLVNNRLGYDVVTRELRPVGISRSSKKTVENTAFDDGFGSNFSSVALKQLLVCPLCHLSWDANFKLNL